MLPKESECNLINHESLRISSGTEILILAGGKGSRLKESTDPELLSKPKPLISINTNRGELPMIDYVILNLTDAGFTNLTFLTSDDVDACGDDIEQHVLSMYDGRFNISFSREKFPLGTAGAAYLAMQDSNIETAIITPADTLFPFSLLPRALQIHKESQSKLTWMVTTNPGEGAQNSGRVLVDEATGIIKHSLEGVQVDPKAFCREGLIPTTSVGLVISDRDYYIARYQEYVNIFQQNGPTDLYRNLIPWLVSIGYQISTFDIMQPAPDLGTPDRLLRFGRGS